MKKITLFTFLLLMSFPLFSQENSCEETFSQSGYDTSNVTLTVDLSTIDCYDPASTPTFTLSDFSATLETYCGSYYNFDVVLDGVTELSSVCYNDVDGLDVTNVNEVQIIANDTNGSSQYLMLSVDVEVTYTPTVAPNCDALLSSTQVDVNDVFSWSAASNYPNSYNLTIGSASGEDDILEETNVGNTTFYDIASLGLNANTTYYVTIQPENIVGSPTCSEQSFTTYPQPENDECSAATTLTVNSDLSCSSFTSGTLSGATNSGITDSFCYGTMNNDVWYTFTATDENILISITNIEGSTSTIAMSIYDVTSSTCGSLDDPFLCQSNTAVLENLTIGNVYLIQAYTQDASIQNVTFDICAGVIAYPENDTCNMAESIALTNYDSDCDVIAFDTTYATDSGAIGSCESYDSNESDLFYEFTTGSIGGFSIEVLEGLPSRLDIAVYDACGGNEVYCESTLESGETWITGLNPESTYILQIWTESYNDGAFEICLKELPACLAPQDVQAVAITETTADIIWTEVGTSTSWEIEYGVTGFTPTGEADAITTLYPYTIEGLTAGVTYDVYVRSDCGASSSGATFNVMNDYSGWTGPITFTTTVTAPVNDDCSNAIAIGTLPFSETIDATGATNNTGFIPECDGMNDGVWYTFETAENSGSVTISITDVVDWDAKIALYSGSCGNFICEGSSDSGYYGGDESMTVEVESNTVYCLNIGYYSGAEDESEGAFSLAISSEDISLSNDNFEAENEISFYPNPVSDKLTISAFHGVNKIEFFDLLGKKVLETNTFQKENVIDVSNLKQGTYFIKVISNSSQNIFKIIKD
ncbi:Por secretion system C-terminal sorting domain-containing protein [Pustulibacterium marinum]|uniref:Por secretion system C-terminal sorting domain-containing protein n=1 Tax=Pustulibacterium marinum TaxID=1224947 RepID=A0A1I7IKU7_9FLAO|nr:T9SS type A sorting domain-containing protein [Pustulibacterium marinum]SFU73524.1 Por secretion system C-terminal sorting domain-containing protein [Pustulibacterium marinum]